MRKHRFFVSDQIIVNSKLTLDSELSHYIGRVLRLANESIIFLFNNSGYEFTAVINDIKSKAITVNIIDKTSDTSESPLKINLAQVIGKGEKMDLVIQKATELGVNSIIPLFSERTVVKRIPEKAEQKQDHWQKIAIAAACQSWRNYVPQVHAPCALQQWLAQAQSKFKIILSPVDAMTRLKDLKIDTSIDLLIGPEGGFSESELQAAKQHGFVPVTLGPRILRTETAGIAVTACLQAMFGDG